MGTKLAARHRCRGVAMVVTGAALLLPVVRANAQDFAKVPDAALIPLDGEGADGKKAADGSKDKAVDGKKPADGKKKDAAKRREGPWTNLYADDWWTMTQPSFELHGHLRVRAEMFHNFSLGRKDPASTALWPRPADDSYGDTRPFDPANPAANRQNVQLCGDSPVATEPCHNATQAGANMRLRIEPSLHISDNLRIMSQIDILDNLVLGSTPEGYANQPGTEGGYQVVARGGYSPTGAFVTTQWVPTSGVTSLKDSITVKRAWGEYTSPVGTVRFGRMPDHWGLGMLINDGNGHDSDWQTTTDRIQALVGLPEYHLYASAAWDFAAEGAISATLNEQQGQPYDLARRDDADRWVFRVARVLDPQLQKLAIARGDVVVNGGAYFAYRAMSLTNETTEANNGAAISQVDAERLGEGLIRRRAEAFVPDLWFQLLYRKFRLELEAAMIYGSIENTQRSGGNDSTNPVDPANDGWRLFQFGMTGEAEWRAIEDRLRVNLGFGLATGDSDVNSLTPPNNTNSTFSSFQQQLTVDRTYSTFRFHPNYRVDLIFFRNILTRVQGAYYVRPNVSYEAVRDPTGHRFGGGLAAIWSRATEPVQAPGHAPDLGVELDLELHYEWRPNDSTVAGRLDAPGGGPGFFTSLQYGVFFPLDGLDYLGGQISDYAIQQPVETEPLSTSPAHALRWQLGVMF